MAEMNPAFSMLQRLQAESEGPEGGEAPEAQGNEITIPDTLADSLANANKHLRDAIQSGYPLPEDAVAQLRVFAQLIDSAQSEAGLQPPTDLPGGPGFPVVPGAPQQAAAGPPGFPPMPGMMPG